MGLAAVAVLLATIAQIKISDWSLVWSVLLFVAGAASLGAAIAGTRLLNPPDSPEQHVPRSQVLGYLVRGIDRLVAIVVMAAASIMLVVSLLLFADGPPYPAAWWLYGASMILIGLALPALDGRWSALARRLRDRPALSVSAGDLAQWSALGTILILALFLRLYDLSDLPAGLWYDEADNLLHATQIGNDPGSTTVFVPSTNLPSMFLMPVAVTGEVAGVSITTPRVVAAAFGLAGIVAVFLLVRLALASTLAIVAGLLMATMRWHVNWSRIGMHGITLPLFAALTAYLTLRALRTERYSDFGFAGAVLGLGQWFYAPYRFFVIVVAAMLLHHLFIDRPAFKRFAVQVGLMAVIAAAVASPVVQHAALEPDEFFDRTRTTSVFSLEPFGDAVSTAWESLGEHLRMFNDKGDPNPRHNIPGAPMVDAASGVLLVLGIGLSLTRWRNTALVILPVWIVIMLLPGALTLPWESPQSLRGIGSMPAAVLAITLAIGGLWSLARSATSRVVRWAAPVALMALLSGVAYANVDTYFGDQASHPDVYAAFSTDETIITKDMVLEQTNGYEIMVSRQFLISLTTRLLAGDPAREVIRPPVDIPIDPDRVTRGVAIYLEPREASVFRLLQAYYPYAEFQEFTAPAGGPVLVYKAAISREVLENHQGLKARYEMASGVAAEGVQRTAGTVWKVDHPELDLPFDFAWEGALHVVDPGPYTIRLDGTGEVLLDGIPLLHEGRDIVTIEPAVGVHSIEIRGTVESISEVTRVLSKRGEEPESVIGGPHLFHGTIRPVGLVGRFYQDGREVDLPDSTHVTHATDVFYYDPVLPEPYLAVWEGFLDVPISGTYEFRASAFGGVQLMLDGARVTSGPVALGAGEHRLRVEYRPFGPPSQLKVLWAPAGRLPQPIPIYRLRPAPEHMFRIISD